MPQAPARVLQLDLFLSDARTYCAALARYEAIRPVLRQEGTLAQYRRITGLSYRQLWRDLQRFPRAGVLGLVDRRALPHPRGRPPIETRPPPLSSNTSCDWPCAHPFTARELARIVRECYHEPIDHRGSSRYSPGITSRRPSCSAIASGRSSPRPAVASSPPRGLPVEPRPTRSAWSIGLGPRTSPPSVSHLRRISDRGAGALADHRTLEVGFRPRRIAGCWRSILMRSTTGSDDSRPAGSWG